MGHPVFLAHSGSEQKNATGIRAQHSTKCCSRGWARRTKPGKGTRSITWEGVTASDTVKTEVNADFDSCFRLTTAGEWRHDPGNAGCSGFQRAGRDGDEQRPGC